MWMRVLNFVGYQAVWFALVVGAARGTPGLAIAAGAAFVILQVATGGEWHTDIRRLILAIALGMFVDGIPALLG
jgi:hypothetical protein